MYSMYKGDGSYSLDPVEVYFSSDGGTVYF